MSLELLQSIDQAEEMAEAIRLKAQQEAREMIKSVEEVCAVRKQAAMKDHRALLHQALEKARHATLQEIKAEARESAKRREAARQAAREKLSDAADFIVERVVRDVYR